MGLEKHLDISTHDPSFSKLKHYDNYLIQVETL